MPTLDEVLRSAARLWLGVGGGEIDPDVLQAMIEDSAAFAGLTGDLIALQSAVDTHVLNHPTGDGVSTAPVYIDAKLYNHELIPSTAIEPRVWIAGGMLHFFLDVLIGGDIPGGNSQTENDPILIRPEHQIPALDTVPLIMNLLQARGSGYYWHEQNDFMIPFATRWSRSDDPVRGEWVIKMQLHQDGGLPQGKRYLSKWPRIEDEKDFVLTGGDRRDHIAGWIPLY